MSGTYGTYGTYERIKIVFTKPASTFFSCLIRPIRPISPIPPSHFPFPISHFPFLHKTRKRACARFREVLYYSVAVYCQPPTISNISRSPMGTGTEDFGLPERMSSAIRRYGWRHSSFPSSLSSIAKRVFPAKRLLRISS